MIHLVHNIGEGRSTNYSTADKIQKAKGLLTFDGVYRNVWEHKHLLEGKDVILFVTGNYVGHDNSFDCFMPRERFCDWNQIMEMALAGAKIGWHTYQHIDLRKLTREELVKEITPPFPMESFAYPYGYFNELVIDVVKECGYKNAYTVFAGDDSDYQIKRVPL